MRAFLCIMLLLIGSFIAERENEKNVVAVVVRCVTTVMKATYILFLNKKSTFHKAFPFTLPIKYVL